MSLAIPASFLKANFRNRKHIGSTRWQTRENSGLSAALPNAAQTAVFSYSGKLRQTTGSTRKVRRFALRRQRPEVRILSGAPFSNERENCGRGFGHASCSARGQNVGADADTALVEEVSVTSANINDGKVGLAASPDNPGEVLADSA
ncbi:MAG: hypothetical protein WCY29_03800 [Novosphingobium sp.]